MNTDAVLAIQRRARLARLSIIRPSHCYIGRCEGCGAVLASCYDTHDKHTGQSVAEMIEHGLLVERQPLGSYELSDCTCPRTVQEEMPI